MRILFSIIIFALAAIAPAGQYLEQSTAVTVKLGPFVNISDGATTSGLTIAQADVRVSKNGGNYAAKNEASSATHDELGEYDVALDATDTNTLGRLRLVVEETGALVVWAEYMVLPSNVYDSVVGGTDNLEVDTTLVEGSDATDQIDARIASYDALVPADAPPNWGDLSITPTTGRVDLASIEGADATDTIGTPQTGDAFSRLGAPAGASMSEDIAALQTDLDNPSQYQADTSDLPTTAEFEARTLPAGSYFDPAADTVSTVTTVVTNQDMRGTDGANTTPPPTANEVRDAILSDSTPFAGGNIDQPISTTESNIRGADDDTLKTLSDAIDKLLLYLGIN